MKTFFALIIFISIFSSALLGLYLYAPSQGKLGLRITENLTSIREARADSQIPLSTSLTKQHIRLSQHANDLKHYIPADCIQALETWEKINQEPVLSQVLMEKKWDAARKYCATMPKYILANLL